MNRPHVDLKTADAARRKYRAGTENGDATMGNCAWPDCGARIQRSDNFVETMTGKLYHTACWPKVRIRRVFTNADGTLKAEYR